MRLANRRLVDFEHARAVVGRLPDQLPAGPFDVVLCADVLFYLTARELDARRRHDHDAAAPGRGSWWPSTIGRTSGSSPPPT
ncbi:MAG: hypothetical protein AB1627_16540 [Chloroflexota bacterium]